MLLHRSSDIRTLPPREPPFGERTPWQSHHHPQRNQPTASGWLRSTRGSRYRTVCGTSDHQLPRSSARDHQTHLQRWRHHFCEHPQPPSYIQIQRSRRQRADYLSFGFGRMGAHERAHQRQSQGHSPRPDTTIRHPQTAARVCLHPWRLYAAWAGGILPLRRYTRSSQSHPRHQARHGKPNAYGPTGVRRCGFW